AGFMLSTTLIAWLPWTLASTMPFLPLLAGLVDRLRARGDRRLVALLALAVALDLVAGYPQAALQALAAIAAWALARAPWRAGAGPFLARVAAGVTLGGGLTAAPAPVIAFGSNLRLMPILVFALATLGALGVDSVARGDAGPRALAWLRGGFMALAGAGLVAVTLASVEPAALAVRPSLAAQYVGLLVGLTAAAWLLRRWLVDGRARWGVALAAVQVTTLAPLATYLPVRDARWLYPTPPAIAWLRDHAGSARVLIADQVGLLYGLRQAHGYDGLSPRRIAELAGPIGTGRAQPAGDPEPPT